MERLFQRFSRLLREDDFRRFQCSVAAAIYDQLSRGYLSNEDEVALVGRIVAATNGKSYVVEFSKAEFLERAKAERWNSSTRSVGEQDDRPFQLIWALLEY